MARSSRVVLPQRSYILVGLVFGEQVRDGQITAELAKEFHQLRGMRNPYSHHIGGLGKRSYMGRLVESEFSAPEDLVVEDAKFAIRAVVDFLRHGSPNWNPDNYHWSEGEAESA